MSNRINILYLLLLFATTLIYGCKDSKALLVNDNIEKYELNSKHYVNTDFGISGNLYMNESSDSCLLILVNKKKDTILKYLSDEGKNFYLSNYIEKDRNYFVEKRKFEDAYYDNGNIKIKNGVINRSFSISKYFLIDTISADLIELPVNNDTVLISKIKNQFPDLSSSSILTKTNEYTYVSIDSTINLQSYYRIPTKYRIKK